jgi:predicted ArsR family transcriptional regulator
VSKKLLSPKPSQVRAREPQNLQPTTAQLDALVAFAQLSERLGRDPTKRELSAELGLSESGAQGHLTQLTLKGCFEEEKKLVVVGRKLTPYGKAWVKRMLG